MTALYPDTSPESEAVLIRLLRKAPPIDASHSMLRLTGDRVGVEEVWEQEKLEARKMLENAA